VNFYQKCAIVFSFFFFSIENGKFTPFYLSLQKIVECAKVEEQKMKEEVRTEVSSQKVIKESSSMEVSSVTEMHSSTTVTTVTVSEQVQVSDAQYQTITLL
jgi:hypothetical protein